MIINFSIKNFGPIKEKQTLSFDALKSTHLEDSYVYKIGKIRLLKIALIYGANASGKTTILKALEFLRELVLFPELKKTDELYFEPFKFDKYSSSKNSLFSLDFLQNGTRYLYEVEFMKKAIVKEELYLWKPKKAILYKRTTNLNSQYTTITFGSTIKIDNELKKALEGNTLWNNTVLGGYLKTNIFIQELKGVVSWFKDHLKSLVHADTNIEDYVSRQIVDGIIHKDDVIDILKKADLNISDLAIKLENKEISDTLHSLILKRIEEENRKTKPSDVLRTYTDIDLEMIHSVKGTIFSLPFELESDGTKRYYGLAGLLALTMQNSIILPIDELESSLHPDLYEHFLLTFLKNAKESQIIATTHNREILNNRDILRNDAIWFTDKNGDCATEIYSLADFDSSVIRDTTNVLNAYKSGKLGGIPKTEDNYLDLNSKK